MNFASFSRPRCRMPAKLDEMWKRFKAASPGRVNKKKAQPGEEATILVYGAIGDDFWGDGNPAKGILEEISSLETDKLRVRINSPGGDVFDGLAIYTAIRGFKGEKVVQIDGLAASAAAVIAMAGDRIEISPAAMVMIHDAWGLMMGNAADALQFAEVLDKIDSQIAGVFAAKTGKTTEEMRKAMDEESWYTAQEAIDFGLADALLPEESGKDGKAKRKAPQQPTEDSVTEDRRRAALAAKARLRLRTLDREEATT